MIFLISITFNLDPHTVQQPRTRHERRLNIDIFGSTSFCHTSHSLWSRQVITVVRIIRITVIRIIITVIRIIIFLPHQEVIPRQCCSRRITLPQVTQVHNCQYIFVSPDLYFKFTLITATTTVTMMYWCSYKTNSSGKHNFFLSHDRRCSLMSHNSLQKQPSSFFQW